MPSPPEKPVFHDIRTQAWILGMLVAVLWGVQIANVLLFNGRLVFEGIQPRQFDGLSGILWAPFLHGSFSHLIANTIPLVTLGWLVMLQQTIDFVVVTLIAALVSGLGTWVVGAPSSVHVGASGVIFGYFGYLLLRGYFERSPTAIAIAVVVATLYGGLLWGVLPTQQGVSWEGHLFGFIGGGIAARLMAQKSPRL